MAKFVKHRTNRIEDLNSVEKEWGVEIDLRSDVTTRGSLHLAHDPWEKGELFADWLAAFAAKGIRGTLILNTKEDGLEQRTIELLEQFKITNYFFLDTTYPTMVQRLRSAQRAHFSCRVSVFEDFPPPELMALIDWVWVDCFGAQPMSPSEIKQQSGAAQLCMVSPELQGGVLEKNFEAFCSLAKSCDLICTKDPVFWKKALRDA